MLTLIHKSIMPIVMGADKIIEVAEKLYFCKTLKIRFVIPTEKIIEKK